MLILHLLLFDGLDDGLESFGLLLGRDGLVVGLWQVLTDGLEGLCLDGPHEFAFDLLLALLHHVLQYHRHLQDLFTGGPLLRIDLQQSADDTAELLGVLERDARVDASSDLLIQPLHVLRLEGHFQTDQLVQHTSQRPDIRFLVIGLILPHFRTRIIRSPCLGHTKPFL
jgi:hypothetical protein